MIQNFVDAETERIFVGKRTRRFGPKLQRVARRRLLMLDAAAELRDLQVPPGNKLEKLSGKRKGQYSIRINDQWRICFVWSKGNAERVEITDYHR